MSKEKQSQQTHITAQKPKVAGPEAAAQLDAAPLLETTVKPNQLPGLPVHPTSQGIRQTAVLQMQRQQGNAHVQRMLRQHLAHKNTPGNNGTAVSTRKPTVQTKLQVNAPGDQFEQEADQVADAVMRNAPAAAPAPPEDNENNGSSPQPNIQTSRNGHQGVPEVSPETEVRIQGLNGRGSPLAHDDQAFFEERMGADFSQVRIHTGSDAVQLSQDLEAKAFTYGKHVAFNEGEYQPGTENGRRLLAHELTHTIQQGAVNRVQRYPDPAEAVTAEAPKAPESSAADSSFQQVKNKVKQEAIKEKAHEPASKKAKESQDAANMPAEEKKGKAEGKKAQEIDSAATAQAAKAGGGKAPGFDKAAFKAAIKAKVQSLTPTEPKKMENIDSSGVMDQVESSVKSKVDSGKESAQGNVDDKVAETPDQGTVADKPVTPLKANDPGNPPQDVGAANAAPKQKTSGEIERPLSARSQDLDQQMAEADITPEQLEKGNEPEFSDALTAKKESQENSKNAPQEYRAAEESIITGSKGEAESAEQTKMSAMHNGRSQVTGDLDSLQNVGKNNDEGKRQEIGKAINGIYENTKKDVEGILKKLDSDVDRVFGPGAQAAASTAISYIKRETKAYKDARYNADGGIGERIIGGIRWIGDELTDMPPEYYEIYKKGRDKYIAEMDKVLDRVADIVGQTLNKAKTRIAQGKQQIETYIAQQPQNLRQIAQEAGNNIQAKFNQLEQSVDDKQNELINSLAEKYNEGLNNLDQQIEAMKEADKGLWAKAKDKIGGAIEMIKKMKEMLTGILASAASVIDKIIKDPIGFLGNLLSGVKQGLMAFVGNIGTHLKKGLMTWLFGAMAEAGISMPESFDLKGILQLVMQVLGLTWQNLRMRAVKMFGEKVVAGLEKVFEVFTIVKEQGIGGLWEFIKEKLSDLKTMVIDGIKDMVITQVIQAGIKWLIGILGGPAGAFVKACMAIYDIVMWFVNNGSQLMSLVQAVISGISAIASGNVSAVANAIEGALAKAVPVVIGFLASLLGLGGIAGKIKGIIQKIQEPINKAIDWVLGKAKALVKKLGKKLFGKKDGKGKGSGPNGDFTSEDKQKALSAIDQAEKPYLDGNKIKQDEAQKVASSVKSKHPVFESVTVVDGGDSWDYQYVFRESGKKEGEKKDTIKEMTAIPVKFPIKDGAGNVYDRDELDRQLKDQQASINSMSVAEWHTNRNRFVKHGRIDNNRKSRRDHRRMYISLRMSELRRAHPNVDEKTLKQWAKEDVDNFMKGKAILHSPDGVMGGSGKISGLGDSDVNSHIGRNWSSRIPGIISEIKGQGIELDDQNVKMNVNLGIG